MLSLAPAAVSAPAAPAHAAPNVRRDDGAQDPLLHDLDGKIQAGMAAYGISGAAVGVWYQVRPELAATLGVGQSTYEAVVKALRDTRFDAG